MSQSENKQILLDWLNREKKKDEAEITNAKHKFIQEIKNFDKKSFFEKKDNKKTLWKRIRMMIWGY